MTKNVALLDGIPEQDKRLQQLLSFRQQLENLLSPKLQTALTTRNETQQYSMHKIYCHLGIESQFIDMFCTFHTSTFVEYCLIEGSLICSVWRSSQADTPTDCLQNFYSSLHTWLISLSDEIISLFGDRDDGRNE